MGKATVLDQLIGICHSSLKTASFFVLFFFSFFLGEVSEGIYVT